MLRDRLRLLIPALLGLAASGLSAQEPAQPSRPLPAAPLFWKGQDYGSDSQFNPLTMAIHWTFDTLQVPESFDEHDFHKRWMMVQDNLGHPRDAIRSRGTFGDFINRQVIPYRMTEPDWIPNYSLHLMGGGMLYRKQAEWLEAQGAPLPRLTSAVLVMAQELAAETIEKASTKRDDEVADVYLFRPLGMLLFSWDRFARFASDDLDLTGWAFQPIYDPTVPRVWGGRGRLVNVGQNFVVRPPVFGQKEHRPFAFFGMTNLFGMSHHLGQGHSLSWGLGAAMVHAQDPTLTRFSGGVFWDRDNSLLASVIFNGTDNLKVRLNVYPGITGRASWWSPGLFVGLGDRGDLAVGATLRVVPIGWGRGSK